MPSQASQIEALQRELSEARETLRAIREGEVDAFVLQKQGTYRVETLASADAPYRVLVESMRDGAVTIARNGVILFCNRPFAEQVGVAPEQIVGQPISSWLELNADMDQLLAESVHGEVCCEGTLSRSGIAAPLSVNFCALPREDAPPVFCLLLRDVSERLAFERLRTEQAILARQHAELDGICSRLPFAVLLAGSADGFSYANPTAEILLSKHEELRRLANEVAAQVLSAACTTKEEVVVRARRGARSIFRLYATPLELLPSVARVLIVLQDITPERQAEKAREEQEQVREQFVGILGHDLRTPLTAIVSAAKLLAANPTPERASRTAGVIQRASARMSRLIEDMLDLTLSRIGGGIPITAVATDAKQLLDSVLEEIQQAASRCAISTTGETWGYWDPARLTQVISNLVANALRYAAANTQVRIEVDGADADKVRISVTNEGEVIPPKLLPVLFDPFRRGPQATGGSSERGMGLGLYIAERFVSAHGGRIQVWSENGETTFTVELPRRSRSEPPPPMTSP